MTTIGPGEPRNQAFELSLVQKRRWVSGAALAEVWSGSAPRGLEKDMDLFDCGLVDPFAETPHPHDVSGGK